MRRAWQGVPLWVWILLGILGLSGGLLYLSQSNSAVRPSAGSTAPSGTRIFATLLREAGFEVDSIRDPMPVLKPNQVPVIITLERAKSDWFPVEESEEEKQFREHITKFVEQGGTAWVGAMSRDFRGSSLRAKTVAPVWSAAPDRSANASAPTTTLTAEDWPYEGQAASIWSDANSGDPLIEIMPHGKGKFIYIRDWIIATNRVITEGDHAAMLVGTAKGTLPTKSKLVFLEAAWGNAKDPSLLDRLGPGFAAAWGQVLITCLVVAYTLGKSFGLPSAVRARQVGQRDLVEATASFFRRAKATDIALQAVLSDARHKILNELKLSRDTTWEVWSPRVPDKLRQIYREVEIASKDRIDPKDAIKIAYELDREVTAFIGETRLATRRRLRQDGTSKRRI